MRRLGIVLLTFIATTVLSGCWIALPSNGPGDARSHVGRTYVVGRDIGVVRTQFHSYAAELSPNQSMTQLREPYTILKAGSQVRIESIVSRREEMGVFYYYRCTAVHDRREFELIFDMRDALGLPKYSYLDARKTG